MERQIIESLDDLEKYAMENDGMCIIARCPVYENGVHIGNDTYAFTDVDDLKEYEGHHEWSYYMSDEPYVEDKWQLA